jgi:hypothetical protein
MNPTDLVLTLEDLPTLRRLTNLTKRWAEEPPTNLTAIGMCQKYTKEFIAALTEELEAIAAQVNK